MALEVGQRVSGDLTVLDSGGSEIALADLRGRAALLIYLRHLG